MKRRVMKTKVLSIPTDRTKTDMGCNDTRKQRTTKILILKYRYIFFGTPKNTGTEISIPVHRNPEPATCEVLNTYPSWKSLVGSALWA